MPAAGCRTTPPENNIGSDNNITIIIIIIKYYPYSADYCSATPTIIKKVFNDSAGKKVLGVT
jgi:hypothetical protein